MLTLHKALGSFGNLVEFDKENTEPLSRKDNEIEEDQHDLESEESEDEVEKYLSMRIDPALISDNPRVF